MLVVQFKPYACAKSPCFAVLPMPDFNDVVVLGIAGRRAAGEIIAYAGKEVELRRE